MNKLFRIARARQHGFSLIEVLIGAVILATGLLALSALQGSLARNAADSRIRSQVAAAMESAAEADRGTAAFSSVPATPASVAIPGVGTLNVTVQSCAYTNLTDTSTSNPSSCAGLGGTAADAQFKTIVYRAAWADATGGTRSMTLTSIVSPRTNASNSTLPFQTPTQGVTSQAPIVRSANPEVSGMIPIAIGDGADTAATNPKPIISSGNVVRTSYEVLTYKDEGSNIVKQQRRVETAVIGCSCTGGSSPTGAQFERPQWPAYWDGTRYSIYKAASGTVVPGTAQTAVATNNVTQDLLCTECCRDHHDTAGTTDVKYDPYRNDAHNHYKLVAGVLTQATGNDAYLEVCRMIRVDGFWRTSQDINSKHFGLLQTDAGSTSATPLPSAKTAYETFVIDYLYANYYPGQSALTSDAMYQTAGLNAPTRIDISKPTTGQPVDKRYLHSRALYVDKVEPVLQARIASAAQSCTRQSPVECILPLLAFTTINVTEPTFWSPVVPTNLAVDTDGFVLFNPSAPNRGTVNALTTAVAGDSNINSALLKSNSGLASRSQGIDPDDAVAATDAQTFNILTSGSPSTGMTFTVRVVGWSGTTAHPVPSWIAGTSNNTCSGSSGTYTCTVPSPLDVGPISIALGGYNYAVTTEKASASTGYMSNLGAYVAGGCQGNNCTAACPVGDSRIHDSFHKNTVVAMCQNISVSSVSASGGTLPAAYTAAAALLVTTNEGRVNGSVETVTLPFTSIVSGSTITINLANQYLAIPTKTTCTPATGNVTGGTFALVCP